MYKYYTLFKASLLDIRNEWSWYLILMFVSPLSIILFLFIVSGGGIGMSSFVSGSIVMVLGTGVFLGIGQTLAMYRFTGSLDYYSTFPLARISVVLAIMFRTIILSFPALIVLFVVIAAVQGESFYLGFPFFVTLVLTSLTLAGLGAIVGITAKNMQVASILTQVLTPVMIYLAPVFYEPDQMPRIPMLISYVIPTTYVAQSIRIAMNENVFSVYTLVLLVICLCSVVYSTLILDWRE